MPNNFSFLLCHCWANSAAMEMVAVNHLRASGGFFGLLSSKSKSFFWSISTSIQRYMVWNVVDCNGCLVLWLTCLVRLSFLVSYEFYDMRPNAHLLGHFNIFCNSNILNLCRSCLTYFKILAYWSSTIV